MSRRDARKAPTYAGEPALIITRGYAGSGKSTAAQAWVDRRPDRAAADIERNIADGWTTEEFAAAERAKFPPAMPDTPRARVNRDDLRAMLVNGAGVLTHDLEQLVTVAQKAQVRALLGAGVSVVVDDTNLRLRFARDWADLARDAGVAFHVWDFTADRERCIANDQRRAAAGGREVGTLAIADMAHRFPQPWPEVKPRERDEVKVLPYVPNPDLPPAYVVDVDGTLAKKRMGEGERDWFDWFRVGEDDVYPDVAALVNRLARPAAGAYTPTIIVLSGRDAVCWPETEGWLREHITYDELYMRPEGDQRDDRIIKAELFDAHVRNRFNVVGVLDDRPKVCRMWREMGLTTFQVGDPHVEF